MRYFKNVTEALFEVERDLVEMGINVWPKSMQNKEIVNDENYQTKELVGYSFRVHDAKVGEAMEATSKFHKVPLEVVRKYCNLEINDRVTLPAPNPGNSYCLRPEVWEPFLIRKTPTSGGRFDYTYAERIASNLGFLFQTLTNDPASRQAVLSIWQPLDIADTGGRRRIPCSLNYQFMVRLEGGRLVLHILYTMRSCDIYTHFGFDVTLAIMLAQMLKQVLPFPITFIHFTMFIGSLHAYRKDYEPRGVF